MGNRAEEAKQNQEENNGNMAIETPIIPLVTPYNMGSLNLSHRYRLYPPFISLSFLFLFFWIYIFFRCMDFCMALTLLTKVTSAKVHLSDEHSHHKHSDSHCLSRAQRKLSRPLNPCPFRMNGLVNIWNGLGNIWDLVTVVFNSQSLCGVNQ